MSELLYTVWPGISTLFIAISAILVAIGWKQIIQKKREAHQKTMFWAAITAIIFFILYCTRTLVVGSTNWGGPEGLKVYYLIFLFFHIFMATIGAVFGITTLTLGYKAKFAKHRKWGKVTAIVWFTSAITGIIVYILLYLMFPGGHTDSLLNTLFKH